MIWVQTGCGGKSKCKYYKACGNTENCKRCESFEVKKDESDRRRQTT